MKTTIRLRRTPTSFEKFRRRLTSWRVMPLHHVEDATKKPVKLVVKPKFDAKQASSNPILLDDGNVMVWDAKSLTKTKIGTKVIM